MTSCFTQIISWIGITRIGIKSSISSIRNGIRIRIWICWFRPKSILISSCSSCIAKGIWITIRIGVNCWRPGVGRADAIEWELLLWSYYMKWGSMQYLKARLAEMNCGVANGEYLTTKGIWVGRQIVRAFSFIALTCIANTLSKTLSKFQ